LPEEVDVQFTEAEVQAIRRYAATLNLTFEEAASLLIDVGFQKVVDDLGAESIQEADPAEIARYLADETEVYDA